MSYLEKDLLIKGMNIQIKMNKFYCCKASTIQSRWSLLLLGTKPKKFEFVPFLTGRHVWAGHKARGNTQ